MDAIAEARAALVGRARARCRRCRQETRGLSTYVGHTCRKDIAAADAYALAVLDDLLGLGWDDIVEYDLKYGDVKPHPLIQDAYKLRVRIQGTGQKG